MVPSLLERARRSRAGLGLAAGLGVAYPLAFAPFGLFPLAPLVLAALLWLWDGTTARRAALTGLAFGLGAFATGISWISISLYTYGNAPLAFALLATFLVILVMSLYPALLGWLLNRLSPHPGPVRWLLAAPALAILLEWIRSWAFTGFPWLSPGYSQIDGPLGGLAPLGGVFTVGLGVWLTAGLVRLALNGASGRRLAVVGLVVLWSGAWAAKQIDWTRPEGPPLAVSLIQGNIAQDDKFLPENLERTLSLYARLSLQEQDRDLIVWPETAIPLFRRDVEASFLRPLGEQARSTNTDYLIGIPDGDWDKGVFYNGVVAIGGQDGFYRKQRLLPFGEYLPLRGLFSFFHELVDIPMADFTSGPLDQPLLRVQGRAVGVSICFEAVFGQDISRVLPEARFLINVSNDAWFGNSLAPHQHLEITRMRSLETGRAMARATNTGISALVDYKGRITERSGMFEVEVLRGDIQPRVGMTPYARVGDWPVVVLSLGLLVVAWVTGRGAGRFSRASDQSPGTGPR